MFAEGVTQQLRFHGYRFTQETPILQSLDSGETRAVKQEGIIIFPPHEITHKKLTPEGKPLPNGHRLGVLAEIEPVTLKSLTRGSNRGAAAAL